MATYKILLRDEETYVIEAKTQDEAEEKASEWFSERAPEMFIEVIKED